MHVDEDGDDAVGEGRVTEKGASNVVVHEEPNAIFEYAVMWVATMDQSPRRCPWLNLYCCDVSACNPALLDCHETHIVGSSEDRAIGGVWEPCVVYVSLVSMPGQSIQRRKA